MKKKWWQRQTFQTPQKHQSQNLKYLLRLGYKTTENYEGNLDKAFCCATFAVKLCPQWEKAWARYAMCLKEQEKYFHANMAICTGWEINEENNKDTEYFKKFIKDMSQDTLKYDA